MKLVLLLLFSILIPFIILFLLRKYVTKRVSFHEWHLLELIGKGFILFAICFQLSAIESIAGQKVKLKNLSNRNIFELLSSNNAHILRKIEGQGLETQHLVTMNSSLLVQNLELIMINHDSDSEARLKFKDGLDEYSKGISASKVTLDQHTGDVAEEIILFSSLSKSSEDIQSDILAMINKTESDLTFINYIFLAMFLIGSVMVLLSRSIEIRKELHPEK